MAERRLDNGIQKLLKAEEEAKKLVEGALEQRDKAQEQMLQQVEEEVKKIESQLEADFQARFGAEGDDQVQQYEAKLQAEKSAQMKEIDAQYEGAKVLLTDLLAHKLGKVEITIDDAIKQAMVTAQKEAALNGA